MEVEADWSFTRGFRYLEAARRCERWIGDDDVQSKLARLAQAYRARGYALMGVAADAEGQAPAAHVRTQAGEPHAREGKGMW